MQLAHMTTGNDSIKYIGTVWIEISMKKMGGQLLGGLQQLTHSLVEKIPEARAQPPGDGGQPCCGHPNPKTEI